MADSSTSGNISALIQIQRSVPARSTERSIFNSAQNQKELSAEDAKAVETAQKFEALLIHNMLKGMRKTTMAENTSNERALYDDMLDEKLANSLMESGGLGVARQILSQINANKPGSSDTAKAELPVDTLKMRELARDIDTQGESSTNDIENDSALTAMLRGSSPAFIGLSATDTLRLKLSASSMEGTGLSPKSRDQQAFLQPLLPHAKRNAEKLGTSPEAVLAIAALETGWGKSVIKNEFGENSNNLFGIKATSDDQPSTRTMTTEYIDGVATKGEAKFRVFSDSAEAVDGFAQFILDNPRYSKALEHAADPERFLKELHNAGYATDPDYANKAISVMKQIESHTLPL